MTRRRLPWLTAAAACLLLPLVAGSVGQANYPFDLAVGLFGAVLTALAFVLAATVDVGAQWPDLSATLARARAQTWAVLALVSIAGATAGEAFSSDAIQLLSLVATAAAIAVGAYAIREVLLLTGGRARQEFLAQLLVSRDVSPAITWLPNANRSNAARYRTAFRDALESDLDRQDSRAVRARFEELSEATRLALDGRAANVSPSVARPLVDFYLDALARAARIAALGKLDASLSPVLARATLDVVEVIGQEQREESATDTDLAAAVELGRLARLLGWTEAAVFSANDLSTEQRLTLLSALNQARRVVRAAADPDAPTSWIAESGYWTDKGLATPRAVATWLWAYVEFDGSLQGGGLYVLHEVFLGQKFFGSYVEGDCVLTPIRAALIDGPTSPAVEAARQFMSLVTPPALDPQESRMLRVEHFFAELATNSLATLQPLKWRSSPALEDGDASIDRAELRERMKLHSLSGTPSLTRDDALRLAAKLIDPATKQASLYSLCREAFPTVEGPLRLPIVGAHQRPAAALLSVALRAAPRTPGETPTGLEGFLARLPAPLLASTTYFAQSCAYGASRESLSSLEAAAAEEVRRKCVGAVLSVVQDD